MKLKYIEDYFSIGKFDEIELPPLTILTGLNGSGKTHLISAIVMNKVKLGNIHHDYIVRFNNQNFTVRDNSRASLSRKSERKSDVNTIIKHLNSAFQGPERIIKQKISGIITQISKRAGEEQISFYKLNIDDFEKLGVENLHQDYLTYCKKTLSVIRSNVNISEVVLNGLMKIHDVIEKPIEDLSSAEIDKILELEEPEFLLDQLGAIFTKYWREFEDNQYKAFRNERFGSNYDVLTDEEFKVKYGEKPWMLVNQVLEEFDNLDYRFNDPEQLERSQQFEMELIHNKFPNFQIHLGALSSGEQTMLALIVSLYKSRNDHYFPKLLLLDEVDAFLHPSMIKSLLNIFQDELIAKNGMRIILATHSPSTVSLAPEESIYIVNKTGTNRIEKTSKDKALKILSAGVPSFSVNYENRRQVFVESPNDVSFYEKIYQILLPHLEPEISLSFISSGESRTDKNGMKISNCGQVENITDTLRDAGNNFVWGIIDSDESNTSKNYIKVLGDGNRYSIENYLLDPLLIAAFLLREKILKREDFNFESNESYIDFKILDVKQLQYISDLIVGKIGKSISDHSLSTVKLLNGIEIKIPKWYLDFQGHKLEEKILEIFPQLKGFNKKEGDLKLEIIKKVIDDVPEIMSIDFLKIFKEIQEY